MPWVVPGTDSANEQTNGNEYHMLAWLLPRIIGNECVKTSVHAIVRLELQRHSIRCVGAATTERWRRAVLRKNQNDILHCALKRRTSTNATDKWPGRRSSEGGAALRHIFLNIEGDNCAYPATSYSDTASSKSSSLRCVTAIAVRRNHSFTTIQRTVKPRVASLFDCIYQSVQRTIRDRQPNRPFQSLFNS